MFAHIASIPRRFPLAFAVWYGGARSLGADLMVQKHVERRPDIDRKRAMVFLGFGLFQVGFVQYLLYVNAFSRMFAGSAAFSAKPLLDKIRDRSGILNVAKQVGLDQFVYHPVMYFPVFYTCQEIVENSDKNPLMLVPKALDKCLTNLWDDLTSLWSIFIPVSCVQFSVVPTHLRVPFVATFGILWGSILSYKRGDLSSNAAVEASDLTTPKLAELPETIPNPRDHWARIPGGVSIDYCPSGPANGLSAVFGAEYTMAAA